MSSFRIGSHRNCTILASHVRELKERNKPLKPEYMMEYTEEKYPNQAKLLNARCEIIPACRHTRKYILDIYEPGCEQVKDSLSHSLPVPLYFPMIASPLPFGNISL